MNPRELPFFQNLNNTELANFVSACEEVRYEKGFVIVTEQEIGTYVVFVASGELRVTKKTGEAEHELARLSGPAIIGEIGLLTKSPRAATVTAESTVVGLRASFDSMQTRAADGDIATLRVISTIAEVVARRLGAVDQKLSELMDQPKGQQRTEDLLQFQKKLYSDWSF